MNTTLQTVYIVGLGNPGSSYACTRHNVGKYIVSLFAKAKGASFKKKQTYSIAEYIEGSVRVCLVFPEVFMNHSGKAVKALVGGMKDEMKNLIVIVDDLETKMGCYSLVFEGGARGHNGLRSIHQELGTKKVFQLRVGVGRPKSSCDDVADFVLSAFTQEEKERIDSISGEVNKSLCQWIESVQHT